MCVCVCVCIRLYSRTTGNEATYERYQQHQCNKRSKNKTAILLKRRRSKSRNRLTALRDPTQNNCVRIRITRSTHTTRSDRSRPRPPPLRKAWSPSSLTPRRQRTCSQVLLLSAFYCCFRPARNWLTGSDDKYRTLAGTRGPSSAASDTA